MKPLIGIGADVTEAAPGTRERAFAYMTYVDAIRKADAIPLIIPPQSDNIDELLTHLDGVLLPGGNDCDPSLYGAVAHPSVEPMDHRRQQNDYTLARLARERRIPALGVCLGLQMMNIAAGGTLIQDIDSTLTTRIRHASAPEGRSRHDIALRAGTRLAEVVGGTNVNVNSSHHQSVEKTGEGLTITAEAPDGVVEGLEDPAHPFYLGVQWHPEDMTDEESASRLFRAFIEAAREHAYRRNGAAGLRSGAVSE
ncbi:MAG TPA: gamma-glutamyl-gamma-aminobutyrate hydrolase family protein [Thermoanaerobaculia bacterium]|nr:gamma-glutamyl-gamma-aminobutyrate hydrolase family protein [Thermoanaerobaculia bacterium]